jgi:hypothetical protein
MFRIARPKSLGWVPSFALALILAGGSPASAEFDEVWSVTIGAPSFFRVLGGGSDGRVYWSGGIGEGADAPPPEFLRCYSAEGGLEWEKKLKSASLWALTTTPDGSGVVSAAAQEPATRWPGVPLIELRNASNGKVQWKRKLKGTTGLILDLIVAGDGSVYGTGIGKYVDDKDRFEGWGTIVFRLSATGKLLWLEILDANEVEGESIALDPKGRGVLIAGYNREPAHERDVVLFFFSFEGELLWSKRRDFKNRDERVFGAEISGNGKNIWVTGDNWEDPEDPAENGRNTTFMQRYLIPLAGDKPAKAKKRKVYDVGGFGESSFGYSVATKNGKGLYLAGRTRVAPFPDPVHGVLLEVNGKGKVKKESTFLIDGDAALVAGFAPVGDGNLVVGGGVGPGFNDSFLMVVSP